MKEFLKMKKTQVLLLSLLIVLACSSGLVTLAVYKSKTDVLTNQFDIGNVTTEIEETFEKTSTATEFKKEPVVTNTGKNDCYVRVRVNASPEKQLDITGWDTKNWVYNAEDKFYYYQKALKAPEGETSGDSTTPLFKLVSVKEDFVDTIEGFEVNVYQEAVQAKMSAKDGSTTTDMMTIWNIYDSGIVPDTFEE